MDTNTPRPTEIKLHQKSRALEISFADGKTFQPSTLSAPSMRRSLHQNLQTPIAA
jgi:DUF971 family protein